MRPKRLLHLSVSQKRDSRAGVRVHARYPFTQSRRALGVYKITRNFFDTGVPHGQRNTSVAIGLLSNTAIRRTVAFYGLLSESADARRANHDSYVYKPVYGHAPYDHRSRICHENPGESCAFAPPSAHRQVRVCGWDEFAITGAGGEMACAPCEIWVMSVLHDRLLQEEVEILPQKVPSGRPVRGCRPVERVIAPECFNDTVSNVQGNYGRR